MHGMVFCLVRFFFRAVGFLFRAVRIFVVGFVGGHLAPELDGAVARLFN